MIETLASALDVVVLLAQEAPKTETREFLSGARILLVVALALIAMLIWWLKRQV